MIVISIFANAKHTEAGEVCDGCGKLLICRNCGKFRSAPAESFPRFAEDDVDFELMSTPALYGEMLRLLRKYRKSDETLGKLFIRIARALERSDGDVGNSGTPGPVVSPADRGTPSEPEAGGSR